MNNIYFDTEFEGLFSEAGLISIGLTDKNGNNTFYAELTDTYNKDKCSQFCQTIVLPLLEGDHYEKKLVELKEELWNWLSERGEDAVLVCDSPRDIIQIQFLFPQGLPINCKFRVIGFIEKWYRRILNINSNVHKKYNLRPHHALDDAIVNRIIFEGK